MKKLDKEFNKKFSKNKNLHDKDYIKDFLVNRIDNNLMLDLNILKNSASNIHQILNFQQLETLKYLKEGLEKDLEFHENAEFILNKEFKKNEKFDTRVIINNNLSSVRKNDLLNSAFNSDDVTLKKRNILSVEKRAKIGASSKIPTSISSKYDGLDCNISSTIKNCKEVSNFISDKKKPNNTSFASNQEFKKIKNKTNNARQKYKLGNLIEYELFNTTFFKEPFKDEQEIDCYLYIMKFDYNEFFYYKKSPESCKDNREVEIETVNIYNNLIMSSKDEIMDDKNLKDSKKLNFPRYFPFGLVVPKYLGTNIPFNLTNSEFWQDYDYLIQEKVIIVFYEKVAFKKHDLNLLFEFNRYFFNDFSTYKKYCAYKYKYKCLSIIS